jgi:hypothetical protein
MDRVLFSGFTVLTLPQLLYSAPDVKHDPANHNYARPAVKRGGPQSFLCSAGVIPSSQPCAKPVLPRTGDVKDGAATAKGGLSLTASSTEACWMPLGPRKFLMPLAGPCFSSGWARRPSQDGMRKMKRNDLKGVLAAAHTAGTSCGAISLHPSSREGHLPPEAAETSLCVSASMQAWRCYQAKAASSFVQRNSVPSTQIRCMMTASLRASATIALFSPRFRATFMAQALSHDHLTLRVRTVWAPS